MTDKIDHQALRTLAECGVIREAIVFRNVGRNDRDNWAIQIKYGKACRYLRSKREDIRSFHTLDTAAKTLNEIGVSIFTVDMT